MFQQKNDYIMKKEFNLSPNFAKKLRNKTDIKFIVIHYTGRQSEIESLKSEIAALKSS